MDVVCNIDDSYVVPCSVMLTSLFENNLEYSFVIHIISEHLSEEIQSCLQDLVEEKYKQKIHFYLVGEDILEGFPIYENSHISMAAYLRLFIEDILPENLNKILYLDCDLIVVGKLDRIWNLNISDYAIGCVEDMWSGKPDNYLRLRYDQNYSYFNSGVLLINLKYWRKIRLKEQAVEFIQKHAVNLVFYDQDVLNGLLYKQKLFIPLRYNLQDGFFRVKRKIKETSIPALNEEILEPVIIHYTGSKKPWDYKSTHPLKNEYYKYLDLTKWKGERPFTPFIFRLKNVLNNFLYYLKLASPKYIQYKMPKY